LQNDYLKLSMALAFLLTSLSTPCHAQLSAPFQNNPSNPGNEYFVGREMGKPLVTVNLVSGVKSPGVYHVPVGTDLAELISYAGGAHDRFNLNDISIQRRNTKKADVSEVAFNDILNKGGAFPELSDRDVIYVAPKTNIDSTVAWVGLISGLASIALSVALINDLGRR
jgi:hypothetical protein